MNGNTRGEQRVRIDFNVSGNSTVDSIKAKTAELINDLDSLRSFDVSDWPDTSNETIEKMAGEKLRLIDLAQTAYEEAAMWAVKAATI